METGKIMRFFERKYLYDNNRGSVLLEFLFATALVAMVLPFVFQYQQRAVMHAKNIAVTRQMQQIQTVLERYMVANKDKMLKTVGRNIIRLSLQDLVEFGLDENVVSGSGNKYQLRILKSYDKNNHATLQGIIILNDDNITPLRTREIVSLGDGNTGFIDGVRAYGGFGTWRTDVANMNLDKVSGLIQTTNVKRDNALYLWRLPSENSGDSMMLSSLNLGWHNLNNTGFLNTDNMELDEKFTSEKIVANEMIFSNRTAIDTTYNTTNSLVSGSMSADSKNMDVSGVFYLSDVAKVSTFTTDNLWVNRLTLSGVSSSDSWTSVLKANQGLDMTAGRISALYVTVGFSGSITPKLIVNKKIIDSKNSNYYWDLADRVANLGDINSPELIRVATSVLKKESDNKTVSTQIFNSVVTNKNATMSDYMNAITEMQKQVRAKYRLLNLD